MPRSNSSVFQQWRAISACGQDDPKNTVRASPSSASPRAPHSSSTLHIAHLVFCDEVAEPQGAGYSISFGPPADVRMLFTASGDELGSGDEDSAALPPSGRAALSESDPELAGCNGGLLHLPSAQGWMIGSWGYRTPITGSHLQFRSSQKCSI